jgi:hypothetical protein
VHQTQPAAVFHWVERWQGTHFGCKTHLILFIALRRGTSCVLVPGGPPSPTDIERTRFNAWVYERFCGRVQKAGASRSPEELAARARQKVATDFLDVYGQLANTLASIQQINNTWNSIRNVADGGS